MGCLMGRVRSGTVTSLLGHEPRVEVNVEKAKHARDRVGWDLLVEVWLHLLQQRSMKSEPDRSAHAMAHAMECKVLRSTTLTPAWLGPIRSEQGMCID